MTFFRRHGLLLLIIALFASNFFIWQEALVSGEEGLLEIAFLDVGQGDAIYIEGPTGRQVLIDGGPDGRVLSELSHVMPFGDTSLDLLIVTNPDKDHYGGFLDVLEHYDIGEVLEPGTRTSGNMYRVFKKALSDKNTPLSLARRGMSIDLGRGARISIMFPDRDVSTMSTNDGSSIMRLDYGSTSILFTGDTTRLTESYLMSRYPNELDADVLKVAHHGSKTSTGQNFVSKVSPEVAVISLGKGNSYGHPHQVTLDTLLRYGVKIFRTDQEGTIVFMSDGQAFVRR